MAGVCSEFFTKGDKKWLEMRKGFITATDSPSLFGLNQYSSPQKVLDSKLNPSFVDNVFTRMGKILEPAVAEATQMALNKPVSLYGDGANLIYYDKDLMLSATPDAYVGESEGTASHVLELKSTSPNKLRGWKSSPPLHYICQLAVQCILLNNNKGMLSILSPQYPTMPIVIFELTLTDAVKELIINEVKRFWSCSSVETGETKFRVSSAKKGLLTMEFLDNLTLIYEEGLDEIVFDSIKW